jgi:simple sugar transport system permease protein
VIIGITEAGIISAGYSGFWTRLVHGFIIVASVSIYALIFRTGR